MWYSPGRCSLYMLPCDLVKGNAWKQWPSVCTAWQGPGNMYENHPILAYVATAAVPERGQLPFLCLTSGSGQPTQSCHPHSVRGKGADTATPQRCHSCWTSQHAARGRRSEISRCKHKDNGNKASEVMETLGSRGDRWRWAVRLDKGEGQTRDKPANPRSDGRPN